MLIVYVDSFLFSLFIFYFSLFTFILVSNLLYLSTLFYYTKTILLSIFIFDLTNCESINLIYISPLLLAWSI